MERDEIDLLTASLREVMAGAPDDLGPVLEELGWAEVVAEDPAVATRLLFAEHGRALGVTAVLDSVVLDVLGVQAGAVLYPLPTAGTGWAPTSTPEAVSGVLLREPAPEARVAVPVTTPGGAGIAVVAASTLSLAPASSIDRYSTWVTATGAAPGALTDAPWQDAVAAAHRALAAEIIGVAEQALQLAIEHTTAREQFGHPIASFQAVRHRLADGEVAIAGARAVLEAAFVDGSADGAAAAKAQASRAHNIVSGNALQVCGAIGSTLEHPLHKYVGRGLLLDVLLGSRDLLTRQLGAMLVRTGQPPLLVEV